MRTSLVLKPLTQWDTRPTYKSTHTHVNEQGTTSSYKTHTYPLRGKRNERSTMFATRTMLTIWQSGSVYARQSHFKTSIWQTRGRILVSWAINAALLRHADQRVHNIQRSGAWHQDKKFLVAHGLVRNESSLLLGAFSHYFAECVSLDSLQWFWLTSLTVSSFTPFLL